MDENDEQTMGNVSKYSKSEVSEMFTKLDSCIKERETSQKWFHNLLSTYSTTINKGMNELIDEVESLQTQLTGLKKEKDDLLVDFGKCCYELEEMKARVSEDPLMKESKGCHENEDLVNVGSEDNNVQPMNAITGAEYSDVSGVEEVTEEKREEDTLGVQSPGSEPPEQIHCDQEETNKGSTGDELEVEDYVCPHCQLVFSEAEYLNAHVQTKHSNLDEDKVTKIETEEKMEEYNLDIQLPISDPAERRQNKTEVVHKETIVVQTNENETKEYICEQCHFIFSKSEYLSTHMQTHHSKSEPDKDSSKEKATQNSYNTETVYAGEVKPSENELLEKMKNLVCKCGYVAPREDLLKLHKDNVHKVGRPKKSGVKWRPTPIEFNSDELARLKQEFETNPFLDEDHRRKLATDLGRAESHIKIWFQRTRGKLRSENIHRIYLKRGKNRTFTKDQRLRLQQEFEQDPFPDRMYKKKLSKELGAETAHISSWFHSMRSRKGIKKSPEQKEQEKKRIRNCEQCSFTTNHNFKMKHHVAKVHDNIKDEVCEDCGYATYYKHALQLHMSQAHGKGDLPRFKCEQCPFTAPNTTRLKLHVKVRHDNVRDQICKECGYAFKIKKDLKRHMLCVHKQGEKKYKCELCPTRFIVPSILREHVRVVHEKIKDYGCEDCGYTTGQRSQLRKHKKTILCKKRGNKMKAEFKCEACPFETFYKAQMERHTREQICTKPKEYLFCDLCQFKSVSNAALTKHKEAVHEKIRKYICQECGFASTTEAYLKTHTKNVHGPRGTKRLKQIKKLKDEFEENPFLDEERAKKIAEELGKPIKNIKNWFYNRRQKGDYKTKVFLEEDMINPKKQTGKQDEDKQKEVKQCEFCPFKAYSNAIFAFHIQAVHDDIKNLVCQECGYAATRKSTLNLHMRNTHEVTSKRSLKVFSLEQLKRLRREFEENPFPDKERRESLAEELGKDESKIMNWFHNKRRTDKIRALKSGDEVKKKIDKKRVVKSVHKKTGKWPPKIFTTEQLKRLKQEFEDNPYPDREHRENLAYKFGKDETQINNWFLNKRKIDKLWAMKSVKELTADTTSSEIEVPFVSF